MVAPFNCPSDAGAGDERKEAVKILITEVEAVRKAEAAAFG